MSSLLTPGLVATTNDDVTGEKASQKAYTEALESFKVLVTGIFANADLRVDGDMIDMISDEMHEILDNELTAYYNSTNPMDGDLDEDDIDDTDEDLEP